MPELQTQPRFVVSIVPVGSGNANIQVVVHAPDVTHAEVAAVLSRATYELLRRPSDRLKTVSEVEAEQQAQANPARFGFVRKVDGVSETVWLSSQGVTVVGQGLEQVGFRNVIDLPEDVQRPCDYLRDPRAFAEKYLVALADEVVQPPPDADE